MTILDKELEKTLKEIGPIRPWRDDDVQAYVFEHPAYPVRYAGDSEQEVIENYPLYLKDFLEERLKGNLAPSVEAATSGRGGFRPGSGRPVGTKKAPTKRVSLPADVAKWLGEPAHMEAVRKLMQG